MSDILIEFFASFLIWFLYAGLIYLWYSDGRIKKEQVLHALLASAIAFIVCQIIKSVLHIERPFMVNGKEPLTLTTPPSWNFAFPSMHTALAFSLSTTIWLHDRRVGWIYLVFSILIGVARVVANVHYPIDIFGGALIGIITSFAVDKLHLKKIIEK